MVPVPEEHEQELMNFLYKLAVQAELAKWSPADVEAVRDAADEQARSVLHAVASATVNQEEISHLELAGSCHIGPDQVMAAVEQINGLGAQRSLPALILFESTWGTSATGERQERRNTVMSPPTASIVVRLEQESDEAADSRPTTTPGAGQDPAG